METQTDKKYLDISTRLHFIKVASIKNMVSYHRNTWYLGLGQVHSFQVTYNSHTCFKVSPCRSIAYRGDSMAVFQTTGSNVLRSRIEDWLLDTLNMSMICWARKVTSCVWLGKVMTATKPRRFFKSVWRAALKEDDIAVIVKDTYESSETFRVE